MLHAIIVEQKEPTNFDGLFLIFERINTGGMQLNQQEIRNSIFQCSMNDLLSELNSNKTWRAMFGQEEPNPRMRDMEMILRFLTLNEIDFLSSTTESVNLVSKMNDFMARHRKETDSQLVCYKSLFCETIDIIMALFGENVFRTNIQTMQTSQKFYATVFDAIMLATACAKKKGVQLTNSNAAIGKIQDLFDNFSFKNACSAHTTDSSAIKARVGAACEVLYGLKYEN